MDSKMQRISRNNGLEEIRRLRLTYQGICDQRFGQPEEVVRWLGAVQAQDFAGAKWAIGLRMKKSSDERVEKAFNEGKFLRTHLLRPTLHFVAADDIRWMLALTSTRTRALWNSYYRKTGIDAATFRRSNDVLQVAMSGGNHLTRSEIRLEFKKARINSDGLRFGFLMSRAELDAIICSGVKRGAQQTYALLDERAPAQTQLERGEALARLALRYFTSHGPAATKDFAWWSGHPVGEARRALESVRSHLHAKIVDGETYWFSSSDFTQGRRVPACFLLPNFDEYLVGYSDRSILFDGKYKGKLCPRPDILSHYTIVCDGEVAGTWKRTIGPGGVRVQTSPFQKLKNRQKSGLEMWITRYMKFLLR